MRRGAGCWVAAALAAVATGCGRFGFDPATRGDGTDTTGDGGVLLGSDGGPKAIDAQPGRANLAFISIDEHTGDLGGVAGADTICQADANAAGLAGTFVAVLRSSERPTLAPLAGSRGWVDVTGAPIADQPEDWLGHRLLSPLHIDALGAEFGFTLVLLGSAAGDDCADWTSTAATGGYTTTAEAPGDVGPGACNVAGKLLCAEVGNAAPVAITSSSGRLAFVTAAGFVPGGGRASADALCATEADAAGLPGSYLALLATSSSTGFDRFSAAGAPWTRVDGARLTATADALLSASSIDFMDNFLNRDATGAVAPGGEAWNGSTDENCGNWTSTSGADRAKTGSSYASVRAFFWQRSAAINCDAPALPIMCLQE